MDDLKITLQSRTARMLARAMGAVGKGITFIQAMCKADAMYRPL